MHESCVPFVLNYNVRLATADIAIGRAIARGVRAKDGGLAKVEALALHHKGGMVEVACNLLEVATTPPCAVMQRVQELAAEHGVEVDSGYVIGRTQEAVLAQVKGGPSKSCN